MIDNIEFEKNKLYHHLGKHLVNDLKESKCFVAGGLITSLFCNRDINDVDIYFRSKKSFENFVKDMWENKEWIVSCTDKATLMIYKNDNNESTEIQLIHFKYFETPEDIFNTFDFTACMGCFDFADEQFYLHNDFLKHNSQRILKFNKTTDFPIVSLLRVQKYKDKGYTISKPEFIRIILTCMNLDINSFEELKDQMGGMYGVNYDKLFNDMEGEDFSLDVAIDKIENLICHEDYFKMPENKFEFNDVEEYLELVTGSEMEYTKIKDKYYKIKYNGGLKGLKGVAIKPNNGKFVDAKDYFNKNKIYKYVMKKCDRYFSHFDNNFEYKINEIVEARGTTYSSDVAQLFFNFISDIEKSSYRHNTNAVLIEADFEIEDIVSIDNHAITVRRAKMTREVSQEELNAMLRNREPEFVLDEDSWGKQND